MIKENNKQKDFEIKEENKIKKISVIGAIILLLLGMIMIFKPKDNTVARIDIMAPLATQPKFEAYINDSGTPISEAEWMQKRGVRGVVASDKMSKSMNITIKALDNTNLILELRGTYQVDENNKIVENWVKYTVFTVDGTPILTEPVEVWHNKPFKYDLYVENDKIYKLHFEWTKADK